MQRIGVDFSDARAEERPHEVFIALELGLLDDEVEGSFGVHGAGLVFDVLDLCFE